MKGYLNIEQSFVTALIIISFFIFFVYPFNPLQKIDKIYDHVVLNTTVEDVRAQYEVQITTLKDQLREKEKPLYDFSGLWMVIMFIAVLTFIWLILIKPHNEKELLEKRIELENVRLMGKKVKVKRGRD